MIMYFEAQIAEGGFLSLADEDVNTIITYNDETKYIDIAFFFSKDGKINVERVPQGFVNTEITSDLAREFCLDDAGVAKYKLAGIIE